MIDWRIFHKKETLSTNTDARAGRHGDVFTADFQTAGRGRLDHKWLSDRGKNLMMSAVLDVGTLDVAHAATLPLAAGLAVVKTVSAILGAEADVKLKWPNDVYVTGLKIAGILCERVGDNVIVGIGVNVRQDTFADEIASRATSFKLNNMNIEVVEVRNLLLKNLSAVYGVWSEKGFEVIYPEITRIDWLKNREISIIQTDDDAVPLRGVCGGIALNGSLILNNECVWAGEAHVLC